MTNRPKSKEIDAVDILDYANRKACDAVRAMPRDWRRIEIFRKAWDEACKERIRQLRGEE